MNWPRKKLQGLIYIPPIKVMYSLTKTLIINYISNVSKAMPTIGRVI